MSSGSRSRLTPSILSLSTLERDGMQSWWQCVPQVTCSVLFNSSPASFFIPVLGFMDDALVLYMGAKLLYRLTPPDVLKQCHKLAKIATISKQEKVGPMPAAVASLVIATLWLFAAIASALMMTYVLHWRNSH
ncbi:MAG TPA: hypothetical protein VGK01_19785 [Candidatus Angelobacter sp.]